MKKQILSTLSICSAAFLVIFSFTGCGNSGVTDSQSMQTFVEQNDIATTAKGVNDAATNELASDDMVTSSDVQNQDIDTVKSDDNITLTADKIVYRGNVTITTPEYDEAYKKLKTILKNYDAVLSSEDYQIFDHNRYNTIEIRIPSKQFTDFMNTLNDIGHITSSSANAENITQTYLDTQTRMKSYETEINRLNELASQTSNVTDLTAIYAELSDVEYQLENTKSQLLNMDTDVKYSYVTVRLEDTHKYSDTGALQGDGTYWSDITYSVLDSLDSFIAFLGRALIFLIYALPYILILMLIIFCIRKLRRKHKAKLKNKSINAESTSKDAK